MQVISLVTQKGGSGKSTLCASLAVAAHEAGRKICILEIDRQATITQWAQMRQGRPPDVAQTTADRLASIINRLSDVGYEFVFVDTPGVDSPGTNTAIQISDLCLIPCRPTPVDLRAMKPTIGAIQRLERDFAFVLNQAPTRGYRVRDTVKGLQFLGILADITIIMRNDHQDAVGTGQGVTELNPTGSAADEIRRLWQWIDQRTTKGLRHVEAA